MFIINISNPITLILLLAITLLLIILAKEIKKSLVAAIPLCTYLLLLVMHVIQIVIVGSGTETYISILAKCITVDFVFIFITFIAYLWIDDVEARATKKKSIDNSLDWFWNKV